MCGLIDKLKDERIDMGAEKFIQKIICACSNPYEQGESPGKSRTKALENEACSEA